LDYYLGPLHSQNYRSDAFHTAIRALLQFLTEDVGVHFLVGQNKVAVGKDASDGCFEVIDPIYNGRARVQQ